MSDPKKKVLLMGKSASGKTSMRSIIFANYLVDVEHSHVRFLGNLVLNLWDCGGQDAFYENYFESQRDHIFRNVELLIYVFDIESREMERDLAYYESCVEAIQENSPQAKVFVLLHKMDLVAEEKRDAVFLERSKLIESHSRGHEITPYRTSIWDETLYKAWSSIVHSLVPNIRILERSLEDFCGVCGADEAVLFERATFLVICHAARRSHADSHRFEKISNIVKQFKLSCSKAQAQFEALEVKNDAFTAFVDVVTHNTYLMVISSDPEVRAASTQLNIAAARRRFEQLINVASENAEE